VTSLLDTVVCVEDFERLAQAELPKDVSDYVDGASGREITLNANRAALDARAVIPRVLADTSTTTTVTRLAGTEVAMPLATAPMAYQKLVHPDGELAAAQACRDAGVPFVMSALSSYPIEEITAVGAITWFQLYVLRDEVIVDELITRAEDAGCRALVVTVDVPIMGRRLRDIRNGFVLPPHVRAANLNETNEAHVGVAQSSAIATHTTAAFDPRMSWARLESLRTRTQIPLVVKGILDPRDAARAVGIGADAIVVSNHGGRQLDGVIPSVDALPAVVEAVGGSCEVMVDSGFRTGMDILRALALGARGVLVGRPLLWALAVAGAEGATKLLSLLQDELRDAMILSGCPDVHAAGQLNVVNGRV
jgi:4-hydroxymandelate oxidase